MKTKMKITSNDSLLTSFWFSSTVLEKKDFISVDIMLYNGSTKNGLGKKTPQKIAPWKIALRKIVPLEVFL